MYDEFVAFLEYNYRRWEEYIFVMFFIPGEHSISEKILGRMLEDYDNLLMSKPHLFPNIFEMYENDNDSFCKHFFAAFSTVYPELEAELGRKTVRFAIFDHFGHDN